LGNIQKLATKQGGTMDTSKIRIKVGQTEVEFEGSEDFIKDNLLQILESISGWNPPKVFTPSLPENTVQGSDSSIGGKKDWGVSTYAAKLKVQTGTELIIATCAYLAFEHGQNSFSRKEILEGMQTATSYYEFNYSKNLSRYFQQLVRSGDLVVTSSKHFALSAARKKSLEQTLAN
jgi:hypothetical protein